jgi:hypothetical protein
MAAEDHAGRDSGVRRIEQASWLPMPNQRRWFSTMISSWYQVSYGGTR